MINYKKSEIKRLFSKIANKKIKKIETLGDGLTYSTILLKIYPDFPMDRIIKNPISLRDRINNLELILIFLREKGYVGLELRSNIKANTIGDTNGEDIADNNCIEDVNTEEDIYKNDSPFSIPKISKNDFDENFRFSNFIVDLYFNQANDLSKLNLSDGNSCEGHKKEAESTDIGPFRMNLSPMEINVKGEYRSNSNNAEDPYSSNTTDDQLNCNITNDQSILMIADNQFNNSNVHSNLNKNDPNNSNDHSNLNKDQLNKDHLNKDHLNKDHLNKDHLNKDHLNKDHLNKDHLNKDQLNKDQLNKDHLNKDHLNNTSDNCNQTINFVKNKLSSESKSQTITNLNIRVDPLFENNIERYDDSENISMQSITGSGEILTGNKLPEITNQDLYIQVQMLRKENALLKKENKIRKMELKLIKKENSMISSQLKKLKMGYKSSKTSGNPGVNFPINEVKDFIGELEKERDFYYDLLLKIERAVNNNCTPEEIRAIISEE